MGVVVPLFPSSPYTSSYPEGYDPRARGADCDNCPCKGQKVVPPTKALVDRPDAILVGQEPGFMEVRQGKPFIGPSGKRLDHILKKNGIERTRLHITNAALCMGEDDAAKLKAYKCCNPRLQNELAEFAVDIPAIPVGTFAFRNVMQRKLAIGISRGFKWNTKDGREVYPTFHPAHVLREGLQWPMFSRDFKRIGDRIKNGYLKLDVPQHYLIPKTTKELEKHLRNLNIVAVGCDIETTEETPTVAKMECISVSDGITSVVMEWTDLFAPLLHEFLNSCKTVVFHNGFAFDTIVLDRYGVKIDLDRVEDTLIAHHVFASHLPQRLAHVVSMYLDAEPWKIIYGKMGNDEKGKHKNLDIDDLLRYNALDSHLTIRSWDHMQSDLKPWWKLYKEDKEQAILCREMQINGAWVDVEIKNKLSSDIKEKEVKLLAEMKELVGWDFSPTKPVDIRKILYEQFGAPITERTKKTEMPSTGKKVLTALAVLADRKYGQFSSKIIEFKSCIKMRVTYLDNIFIEPDGRVHPSWKSFGTPTGRLACRGPNLTNLKKIDDRKKDQPEQKIRTIYRAPPGRKLISFDLSQVEPKVAAYISQDEVYIQAVESGDMHTFNAKILFGELPELMDPVQAKKGKGAPMRNAAKIFGLALNYLAGAVKLHETLLADKFNIKLGKVIECDSRLKSRFTRYFEYVDEKIAFCKKRGYIVTGYLSGRIRWFGHLPEASKLANTDIQGTAADVMNIKLKKIRKIAKDTIPGVLLIGQIHDAGIFEINDNADEEATMIGIIKEVIKEKILIKGKEVEFKSEIKAGYNWAEV
jgi:uracil-DNA glycosylase family 4